MRHLLKNLFERYREQKPEVTTFMLVSGTNMRFFLTVSMRQLFTYIPINYYTIIIARVVRDYETLARIPRYTIRTLG